MQDSCASQLASQCSVFSYLTLPCQYQLILQKFQITLKAKSLYFSFSRSSALLILSRCYFLIAIPIIARKLRASALPSFICSAAYRLALCRSRSSRQLLYRLQRNSRCSSISSLLQSHLLLVPLLNQNKQLFRQLQPSLIVQYALYVALELVDVISSPIFCSSLNRRKQLLGPCRFLVCTFEQALD